MIHNYWKEISTIAFLVSTHSAFASEAWLIITSDPPGATILVDNAYRGVTPQHSGDALRIKVVEGIRKIQAGRQIEGKKYVVRKNIEVIGDKEIPIKFNFLGQTDSPEFIATMPYLHHENLEIGQPIISPMGKMEVPGKNF